MLGNKVDFRPVRLDIDSLHWSLHSYGRCNYCKSLRKPCPEICFTDGKSCTCADLWQELISSDAPLNQT
ncbi:hypothetical protein RRG08_032572 [Elysia crispata]|uniref:Uncharacterized protein n=1 Tax=Elysia crispata TaxID=231223 RepID=A0AAE0ZXP0_9GAST|nr:hypothetical protein RRG08_032572 [Elysia crispata]